MAVFTKLATHIREIGVLATLLYGVGQFLRWSGLGELLHWTIVAQPVSAEPLLRGNRGRSIRVDRVDPLDPKLACLGDLTADVQAFRQEQGSICFAAYRENDLVGYLWLCPTSYSEDQVRCRFVLEPTGESVWDYGLYIRPDMRSGFAFARLWDAANSYMRQRGIRWSISRISAFNRDSVGAHRRLGAERLGLVTFVIVGGWQLTLATMRPFVHLSLGPGRYPSITVGVPSAAAMPLPTPQLSD